MKSFDSKAIIFDLDGTLIDSAEGIRQSIKNSFNHLNIDLEIDLNDLKIGPPLNETLLQCNKNITQTQLLKLRSFFMSDYDKDGCKKVLPFDGVYSLIKTLFKKNINIFIATNKRQIPTLKILDYLEWTKFFKAIYCIDSFILKETNKSRLLELLINKEKLKNSSSIYIGDKLADYKAACDNKLFFIGADFTENDLRSNDKNNFRIVNNLQEKTIMEILDCFSEL